MIVWFWLIPAILGALLLGALLLLCGLSFLFCYRHDED